MDDLYTLMQNDFLYSADKMISLLEKIASTNVFDSLELYNYLDRYKSEANTEVVQKVKNFKNSTISVKHKPLFIREFSLN
ncbi:hypothetical protein [Ancylomarina longa]|nr:hypothetical protein [Ancylomarina longa]